MSKKTTLHLIFVGKDRKVIRELYTDCVLFRSNVEIPYIITDDLLIRDILGTSTIKFYDNNMDRFNFKVTPLNLLQSDDCELPKEIRIEILDIDGTYIHLEPGLWKTNRNNELYRICDDALFHIILEQFTDEPYDELDADCTPIKHHTLMDNFFFAHDHLMLYISDDNDTDDVCDDECDEYNNQDCIVNDDYINCVGCDDCTCNHFQSHHCSKCETNCRGNHPEYNLPEKDSNKDIKDDPSYMDNITKNICGIGKQMIEKIYGNTNKNNDYRNNKFRKNK